MDFITLIFLLISLSIIVTLGGVRMMKVFFPQWGLVDKPHLYPHERGRKPLPYPGGVILAVIFFIGCMVLTYIEGVDKKTIYLSIFGLCIALIMGMDDIKRNLSPVVRLGIQIGVGAFFGITAIKIGYMSNIFGGIIQLDSFTGLQWDIGDRTIFFLPLMITIFWYVLIFNAYNWSDSGSGMSSGLALTTLITLLVLSVKLLMIDTDLSAQENSLFVIKMLAILIPSIAIYWYFDVKKYYITGDAGTMFLGFIIASLAIISGGKIATVAICLGVYLIDAFYVILRRILAGKNPMKGDNHSHFHHRMRAKGYSDTFVRWTVYILSLSFGLGAIWLDTSGKIILFLSIACIMFFIEGLPKKTIEQ